MEKPLHHFDKRIIRRSIKKGLLNEEEAASHLTSLEDQSGNIMPAEVESPEEEVGSDGPALIDSAADGA
jgi:hypothetical protein